MGAFVEDDGVSGKPALIRESDVARIVKGYAKAGVAVKAVVRSPGVLEFVPDVSHKDPEPVDDEPKGHL